MFLSEIDISYKLQIMQEKKSLNPSYLYCKYYKKIATEILSKENKFAHRGQNIFQ
jgi:hypothetical protein